MCGKCQSWNANGQHIVTTTTIRLKITKLFKKLRISTTTIAIIIRGIITTTTINSVQQQQQHSPETKIGDILVI